MEETSTDTNIVKYNEIHLYKQARGRCTDTVIVGLSFNNKDNSKIFVSSIKKKFGITGCQKMMDDMDKENPTPIKIGCQKAADQRANHWPDQRGQSQVRQGLHKI